MSSISKKYRTWVEISKTKLISNVDVIGKLINSSTKIMAVVKANAYGHGMREVSRLINKEVDCFGVDSIDEGLQLRFLISRKPIVVMGFVPVSRVTELTKNHLSMVVGSIETLEKLSKLNLKVKTNIHLKIETGLNRQGIKFEDLSRIVQLFTGSKLSLEGVMTHFAEADDERFLRQQSEIFMQVVEYLGKFGFKNLITHCSATSTLFDKKKNFGMVRVGIGMYGLWPYKGLEPVLSWKSIVAQVKFVEKGESVGYGRTWFAKRKTKIAVIPVGYFDGFDRGFSNNGRVLVKGKFASVIGRVSMNMITVDISQIKDVGIGDEVVIIGEQGKNMITADELAQRVGTINYEIVSRINPSLSRVVV